MALRCVHLVLLAPRAAANLDRPAISPHVDASHIFPSFPTLPPPPPLALLFRSKPATSSSRPSLTTTRAPRSASTTLPRPSSSPRLLSRPPRPSRPGRSFPGTTGRPSSLRPPISLPASTGEPWAVVGQRSSSLALIPLSDALLSSVLRTLRYKLMAATMLGQGKNAWQAEIDAAAEVRLFDISLARIRMR